MAASPPEACPKPPGRCTLWVPSKTTGAYCRRIGNERKSTTRLPYPNVVPRSHRSTGPPPPPALTFATA